jgi:hypothetical protein
MTSRVQGLVSDESNPRPAAAELSSSRFALILMVCIALHTFGRDSDDGFRLEHGPVELLLRPRF